MVQEPHDETEYQFNDAEDATFEPEVDTTTQDVSPEGIKKPSRARVIIIVVVALVAIFIVYKLFSFFAAPKKSTPSIASISTQNSIANSTKQQSGTSSSIPSMLSQTAVDQTNQKDSQAGTTSADQQLTSATQQAIQDSTQIQHQLNENQTRLTSLSQQISTLGDSISELQSTLSTMQAQQTNTKALETQLAQYKTELQELTAKKIRLKKQYFVQAVVPGRAWLRGADGTTETVAVGDILQGYGKVNSIDAYSGEVTTSSGTKIYYGLDEN